MVFVDLVMFERYLFHLVILKVLLFSSLRMLLAFKVRFLTFYVLYNALGCGFVRFTSVSDAARAIHELNGKYIVDSVCSLFLNLFFHPFLG